MQTCNTLDDNGNLSIPSNFRSSSLFNYHKPKRDLKKLAVRGFGLCVKYESRKGQVINVLNRLTINLPCSTIYGLLGKLFIFTLLNCCLQIVRNLWKLFTNFRLLFGKI